MKVEIAGATDPGLERERNEDAFAVFPAFAAAVLADGLGGLAKGDVASSTVVEAVGRALASGTDPVEGLRIAHRQLNTLRESTGGERMGSTAVLVTITQQRARIAWVGDSRAYLWRQGALKQLTRDHSLVARLLEAGVLTPEEAEVHPQRNALTRAIGVTDTAALEIDAMELELDPGDRLLLSSDGLHGFLREQRIAAVFRDGSEDGADELARELVTRTLAETEAGDNVTVVCVTLD
jgi:protein phosphatase